MAAIRPYHDHRPTTSVFKWPNQDYNKPGDKSVQPARCRNNTWLWLHSFHTTVEEPKKCQIPGTWSKYFHASTKVIRGPKRSIPGGLHRQLDSDIMELYTRDLNIKPGSLRVGPHLDCYNCNQLGHSAHFCPYPCSGLPIPNVAPDYPFGPWTRPTVPSPYRSNVPPPPPPPPNVPPPPPLPFNTNHSAMIGKFGGAIWHSVQQIFLPPIT